MQHEDKAKEQPARKKIYIWRVVVFVFIAILLLLTLAFGSLFCRKQAEPLELEKVTLGVAEIIGASVWVAEAKGFFKEEGLDLTLKGYPSGKWALKGMFNNEVDIATTSEVPVMFNSFDRQDFLLFATIGYSDSEPKIIAHKGRGINEASDLTGKVIATQKSSAVHFFLSLFLMQNYIPESEVNIVYMKPTDLAQALINGEIDAISMRDPYTKYAKDVLADKAVEFSALGLYRKTFNLVAKKYFIDDRPEAIKKILQGILKAKEYIQKNRKESVEIVARSLKMDRESIDSVWDDYNFSISLDQSLLVSLEDEARWAIEQGFTEKTKVPNYLDFIYYDGLEAVEPYAVTIIH